MTFTDLRNVVGDYCNLSSSEAMERVGRSLNRHYRRVTASLGLDDVRFVTRSQTTTNGQQYVVFTEIEKIDRVIDATDSNAIRVLTQVSIDRQRTIQPGTSQATTWALRNTDADSVTILLDTLPQTTYSLQADGTTTLSNLTGDDEPVFPESYHDILSWYVIAEELLRKEKVELAQEYANRADRLLSELRQYLAESPTRDVRQAALAAATGTGAAGGSASLGGTAYTQSALLTFEQSTLRLLDTDETHGVTVNIGSNLTAERTLSLVTGDASRIITLSGDPTLSDWFDQSVKSTASPTFAAPIASTAVIVGAATTSGIRLDLESGTLAVREGDDSAYGPVKALTLEATTTATVGTTLTTAGAVFSANATLSRNTSDGSDTGGLAMSGGGAFGNTRGATVSLWGNEHATTPGDLDLFPGNVAGGTVNIYRQDGTLSASVDSNGTLVLAHGQISFPATQNASSGANTLDDYEEGTWTPVIGGSGGTSGQTYSAATSGKYTKIGNMVYASFLVELTAEGTITTNAQLQGFPFSAATGLNDTCALVWQNLATNWVSVVAAMAGGFPVANLVGAQAAAATNNTALTAADIGNTTLFAGTMVYRV